MPNQFFLPHWQVVFPCFKHSLVRFMLKISHWGKKITLKSWYIDLLSLQKTQIMFFFLKLFYKIIQPDRRANFLWLQLICDWRNFAYYNSPGLSYVIFSHRFLYRYEPTITVGCLVASDQWSLCFWCDFCSFLPPDKHRWELLLSFSVC